MRSFLYHLKAKSAVFSACFRFFPTWIVSFRSSAARRQEWFRHAARACFCANGFRPHKPKGTCRHAEQPRKIPLCQRQTFCADSRRRTDKPRHTAELLLEEYEIIKAADDIEALEHIREYGTLLSLVLLDLVMPRLGGLDVLQQIKADPALSKIPVIILISDDNAELVSLNCGASDFIPKPYKEAIIKARVRRTIELPEDRDIIRSTERDHLTGLYNPEFFFRYAEQFDQFHADLSMDALVVDINHFHMINERYGKQYGDEVLTHIGETLREKVSDAGGIVCRREADTFLVYCPHCT
ncbi:MAG: diguanylate cyclase [Mailhella sp.]|nr:diguanylate cyclase [Mailhella sp.]